jgi:Zn-dependent M16 (insulinase) family peptidase
VEAVAATALDAWSTVSPGTGGEPWRPSALRETRNELWITNTQVNFCARAYPTVPVGHPDAAALTVLGAFLRNGYLHRAIREQGGAYGGGASQDSGIAAFRFYSYRDPRLCETLDDFDASIQWLREGSLEQQQLEEAILGIIGSLDKPSSPAGEAKQHFHNRLFGRTHDQREAFRQQVLSVAMDDIRRVAETYLTPDKASTAVITSSARRDADSSRIEELRLSVEEL